MGRGWGFILVLTVVSDDERGSLSSTPRATSESRTPNGCGRGCFMIPWQGAESCSASMIEIQYAVLLMVVMILQSGLVQGSGTGVMP